MQLHLVQIAGVNREPDKGDLLEITCIYPNNSMVRNLQRGWPEKPDYIQHLRPIINKFLGVGAMAERVKIKAWDFTKEFRSFTDMLVDEAGHQQQLLFNPIATHLYQETLRIPHQSRMPYIVGPAIVFSRRIWF